MTSTAPHVHQCIICDDESPKASAQALINMGWQVDGRLIVCPTDQVPGASPVYDAEDISHLIEFVPVEEDGQVKWEMWGNPYFYSGDSYRYFDGWERLGYSQDHIPSKDEALAMVAKMQVSKCATCGCTSRLSYSADLENIQGWQLLPQAAYCPTHINAPVNTHV